MDSDLRTTAMLAVWIVAFALWTGAAYVQYRAGSPTMAILNIAFLAMSIAIGVVMYLNAS